MKKLKRVLSTLIMIVALGLISSQSSMAASTQVPETDSAVEVGQAQAGLTAEQFSQMLVELKQSPLTRTVTTTATDTRTTYDLPEGFTMTVVESSTAPGGIQPRIGGGSDGGGAYVLFNQFDQDMLYAGTGALLGAALCAIPGVGWLACLGVSLLVAAATTVVVNSGKCTNNRQLKMYIKTAYSSCV